MIFWDYKRIGLSLSFPIPYIDRQNSSRRKVRMATATAARNAELKEIFDKYATVQEPGSGEMYMTTDTFMYNYLDIANPTSIGNVYQDQLLNQQILARFCNLVSHTKPGLISYSEFEAFEEIFAKPDVLYRIMFMLVNISRSGRLSLQELTDFMKLTENQQQIPALMNESEVVKLYFGPPPPRTLSYHEFCQFLHDFNQEFMQRVFRLHDPTNSGSISFDSCMKILDKYKPHLVSPNFATFLAELKADSCSKFMPYSMYASVVKLLDHLPVLKLLYLKQTEGRKSNGLGYDDLVKSLNLGEQFNSNMDLTPYEIQLLFTWVRANNKHREPADETANPKLEDVRVTYADLQLISPDKRCLSRCEKIKRNQKPTSNNRSYAVQVQENAYRFFLGALAGAFGAVLVYPIDVVKTRMQNQRLVQKTLKELVYKNSIDCARKIVRYEGVLGLYRGLLVQLLGVMPEKALKLAVNDFVREKLTDATDCSIPVKCEFTAGALAGASQVMVTNPLEIVKIRLQTATQVSPIGSNLLPSSTSKLVPKATAMAIIKDLGFRGLYKGFRACILRDSLFTGIYFTVYANVKEQFEDDAGYNSPGSLFVAGVMAGIPASSFATPADVIKTRLQVIPKPGQTVYNGIVDCARKIYREEGLTAFGKGVVPRILRSAPQFGLTILGYELLQRYLFIDFGGSVRPKGSITKEQQHAIEYKKYKTTIMEDLEYQLPNKPRTSLVPEQAERDRIGGYKYAPQVFHDVQRKFWFKYLSK